MAKEYKRTLAQIKTAKENVAEAVKNLSKAELNFKKMEHQKRRSIT